MQIEYEISEQDFLDAQKLALKKHPKLTTRLLFRILPFWGLLLFLGVAWPVFQRGFVWNTSLMLPLAFAVLAVASPFLLRLAYKRIYRQNTALQGKRSVAVDESGLSFTGPAFSSHLDWKMFQRFVEDDKTFILYQSNQIVHPIPKRELSQDQLLELREAFTRNIVSRN